MAGFGRRAGGGNAAGDKKGGGLTKVTGLFENEGKSYLSVSVKEDITIPGGTTLFLFENDPAEAKKRGIKNPAAVNLCYGVSNKQA